MAVADQGIVFDSKVIALSLARPRGRGALFLLLPVFAADYGTRLWRTDAVILRRSSARHNPCARPSSEVRLLCRFSDAGIARPIHALPSGVGKAPRHEIAVGGALAVLAGSWGIERGVGLKENEAKRSSPWLWPKAWVCLQGRTSGPGS